MLTFSINIFFKKILKENKESDGIFENISFAKMEWNFQS
jgi:hypothetical protein